MLGSFNYWNIIRLTNKTTCIEEIDEVHKLFMDGISVNMASLLQTGKYGDTNDTDPTKLWYYIVRYV